MFVARRFLAIAAVGALGVLWGASGYAQVVNEYNGSIASGEGFVTNNQPAVSFGTVAATTRATTPAVRATGAAGLRLEDDGGTLGLFVEDGGQVGIGTAAPGYALDVVGDIFSGESTNGVVIGERFNNGVILGSSSDGYNSLDIRAQGGIGSQLFVHTGGNVGIGTVAPVNELDVNGDLTIRRDDDTIPTADTAYCTLFATNSTSAELQVIDGAGNVTELSPHQADRWFFQSFNVHSGKRTVIDMEALAAAITALGGPQVMTTTYEAPLQPWDAKEAALEAESIAAGLAWDEQVAASTNAPATQRPAKHTKREKPQWLKDSLQNNQHNSEG